MSAHLIVPTRDECQSDVVQLIPKNPPLAPNRAGSAGIRSRDRLLGIMGIFVVGAILGSTIYCVIRFLL